MKVELDKLVTEVQRVLKPIADAAKQFQLFLQRNPYPESSPPDGTDID
jgi:hypothetical protein